MLSKGKLTPEQRHKLAYIIREGKKVDESLTFPPMECGCDGRRELTDAVKDRFMWIVSVMGPASNSDYAVPNILKPAIGKIYGAIAQATEVFGHDWGQFSDESELSEVDGHVRRAIGMPELTREEIEAALSRHDGQRDVNVHDVNEMLRRFDNKGEVN